jgi:23S rRNA pseudouridine2605 synthase
VRSATFLCNRSPGEGLTEPREGEERGALVDRLSRRDGKRYIAISPMPRMDGGLEVMTSDGALAAALQRGVRHLQMDFSLRVRGELLPEQIEQAMLGELDSGERLQLLSCEPAGGEAANRWYLVETRGANGRDLRSLFERQGAVVSRILRVRFGSLQLERSLVRGQARALEDHELQALRSAIETPVPEAAPDAG